ncbi:hypothetical protein IFM89_000068, partial [Coptis chinensis]
VSNRAFRKVCGEQVKPVVNGSIPGPTIKACEGDTIVIHVINNSPYKITIHWHGVFQLFSGWADGPAYVTQCPIIPGTSYTYKFNVTKQEGTLWWHAHFSMLRETVYGALIIHPRRGHSYPFSKPYKEVPILLGAPLNSRRSELPYTDEFMTYGGEPMPSDAFTINGRPGDLYPCSSNKTFKLKVVQGKTYLLRMINAAMSDHLFFKIAQHSFSVVAIDARYTEPYHTDVIVIAPGQSADVLFTANQPLGNYYMAAHPYTTTAPMELAGATTTAIVQYSGATSSKPLMPILPWYNDTMIAHKFFSNLTSLTTNSHWRPVPQSVDEHMFITINMGLEPCGPNITCKMPMDSQPNDMDMDSQYKDSANMNNVSFQFPSKLSMLEAFHHGVQGIYTEDFPNFPPLEFDYTNPNMTMSMELLMIAKKETRVKRLKYNSVVEVVLQNTALMATENHPMHIHGFDFYVLAQGFGNYDPINDPKKFNLVNPQERNTIAVPIAGWAVIRFRANNPGMWLVHCHREPDVLRGQSMAFLIENGPTPSESLPLPPLDLPQC